LCIWRDTSLGTVKLPVDVNRTRGKVRLTVVKHRFLRSIEVLLGRRDHEKFNYRLVYIKERASSLRSKQINREDFKEKKLKR
jgi:hypothetical protein